MRLFLTLIVAIVAGCGGLPSRTNPSGLPASNIGGANAVIILSTGAAEGCRKFPPPKLTELAILRDDATYSMWHIMATFLTDDIFVKSDFDDHPGNLHSLTIVPGDYFFAPYQGTSHPIQVPKYNFSVSAGEVVYLGEYWLTSHCGLQASGNFQDREQRDMALLTKLNPTLANAHIVKRIPAFSGYALGINPR